MSHAEFYYEGFSNPNGTIVPDDLFDVLAPELSEAELRVLLYIIRRTFGFKKDKDQISLSQMVDGIQTKDGKVLDKGTGLSRRGVMNGCAGLIKKGIITVEKKKSAQGDSEINTYSLRFRNEQGVGHQMPYPREVSAPPVGHQMPPQQTVLQETDLDDVVAASLRDFGISPAVARQLAATYPEDYLLQKLELVHWLVDTKNSLVKRNPAGFLRKAIEEDYQPPKGYKSKAQRESEEANRSTAFQAAQEERRQAEAVFRQAREEASEHLRHAYPAQPIDGTQWSTATAWEQVLKQLQERVSPAVYMTWLADTRLLEVAEEQAIVGVPTRFAQEWIGKHHELGVTQELQQLLGYSVQVEYQVVRD